MFEKLVMENFHGILYVITYTIRIFGTGANLQIIHGTPHFDAVAGVH